MPYYKDDEKEYYGTPVNDEFTAAAAVEPMIKKYLYNPWVIGSVVILILLLIYFFTRKSSRETLYY